MCVSRHESCTSFIHNGNLKEGCILSEHCGQIGSFLGVEGIKFECPVGIKEIDYHQSIGFMGNYE